MGGPNGIILRWCENVTIAFICLLTGYVINISHEIFNPFDYHIMALFLRAFPSQMVRESFHQRGTLGHEGSIGVCVWWTGYNKEGAAQVGLEVKGTYYPSGARARLNIVGLSKGKKCGK